MLANTPPMLEAHYGVPMTGAVLLSMNTRLDAAIVAFQLDHAETKVADLRSASSPAVMREALTLAKVKPLVIDYNDAEFPQTAAPLSDLDYDAFVAAGDPAYAWAMPTDEWQSITLNYTSGTTGNPKGVVYSHRGAALMCYANTVTAGLGRHPVYLWTLPMFHCNGWCFPWTLSLVAGTHICLRWVRAKAIFDAIADHRVSHLCGAPIVMGDAAQRARGREAAAAATRWSSSPLPPRRRRACWPPWPMPASMWCTSTASPRSMALPSSTNGMPTGTASIPPVARS